MASIAYDIDKQDFMRWLRERPEQIFRQANTFDCALAQYLSETTRQSVHLTYDSQRDDKSDMFWLDGYRELPDWAVGINRMAHGLDNDRFTGAEILAKLEAADAQS